MSGDRERRAWLEQLQTELRDLRAGTAPPEPAPEALAALEAEVAAARAAAEATAARIPALQAEVDAEQAEFHRLTDAVQALHVRRLPGWDFLQRQATAERFWAAVALIGVVLFLRCGR